MPLGRRDLWMIAARGDAYVNDMEEVFHVASVVRDSGHRLSASVRDRSTRDVVEARRFGDSIIVASDRFRKGI